MIVFLKTKKQFLIMKGEFYMISTNTIKIEKCKFCGKELEQKTMRFVVGEN